MNLTNLFSTTKEPKRPRGNRGGRNRNRRRNRQRGRRRPSTAIPPQRLLRAKVLRALRPCGDYWLDSETLLIQLALTEPSLTPRQLADALVALREKGWVDYRIDELSALTEWRLTPAGQALVPLN